MGSYPFRFYGRGATDWYEGANDGHSFSVQFRSEPSDAEGEVVAELFEQSLATGVARASSDPWLWSGRFATFRIGERWISNGGHIGAVAGFLRTAHELVPIADVVYVNRRAGEDGWDRWSRSISPPDPGRDEKLSELVLRRAIDPTLGAMEPRPAFEDARRRARDALAVAKVDDLLAAAPKAGKVGLVRVPKEVDRAVTPIAWPEEVRAKFAPDEVGGWAGRPIALLGEGRTTSFAWLDERGVRAEPDAPPSVYVGWPRFSPDYQEALTANGEVSYHVDLRTREVTEIHHRVDRDDGFTVCDAAWLDAGGGAVRWAVFTDERLLVFDPTRGKPELVLEYKGRCTESLVARGGRVIITSDYGKNPKVQLFHADKLKAVGTFKAKLGYLRETDGRILLYAGTTPYELTHVDELLAALTAPKAKKPRASTKTKTNPSD
jgi:hypothetical protein